MIQIKNRDRAVLYASATAATLRDAVEEAVEKNIFLYRASLDGACLDGANLNGASLDRARLNGANLDGASLNCASLNCASLNCARLDGASLNCASLNCARLDGATYGDNVPCTQAPLQLLGSRYDVLVLDRHVKIGCEIHATEEWRAYGQRQIEAMDGDDAWTWWQQYRDTILAMADARRYRLLEMEGRENDPDQRRQ